MVSNLDKVSQIDVLDKINKIKKLYSELSLNIIEMNDDKSLVLNGREEKIENIYEEVQNPLVATILFFFFQMPYFSNLMKRQIPSLFNTTGTPTLIGHLFKASLFGFGFYGITKISNYLSEM